MRLGAPVVATAECDAHARLKQVLAGAGPADVVECTSVAGLPARAVLTPGVAPGAPPGTAGLAAAPAA